MCSRTTRWAHAVVLGLVFLLSACTGGTDDERSYNPSIGSNERTSSTDALGVAIVVDGKGNGRVVGTLLNTTDTRQRLTGATISTERGPASATLARDDINLPPNEPVQLARTPAVSVASPDGLPVGLFVEMTFVLDGAPSIEMLVPVEAQKGPYAEIEVTKPPDGDVAVG